MFKVLRYAPLVGVFLISLILGIYDLDANPFWRDELATWRVITRVHLIHMIRRMNEDNHLPLYFIIMKLLKDFLGLKSMWALRFPSVLFYTLGNMTLVYAALKSRARFLPWIVAFLCLAHLGLLQWSQEFRPYSLFYFLICLYLFFLTQEAHKNFLCLFLVGILALYTHYFAGLTLFVSFAVYIWLKRRTFPKITLHKYLGLLLGWAIVFLPWWLMAKTPIFVEKRPDFWVPTLDFLEIESSLFFIFFDSWIFLGVIFALLLTLGFFKIRTQNTFFYFGFCFSFFCLIILKSWLTYSVMVERYFIGLVPFVIFGVSLGVSSLMEVRRKWGMGFCIVCLAAAIFPWTQKQIYLGGWQRTDLAFEKMKKLTRESGQQLRQQVLVGLSNNSNLFRFFLEEDKELKLVIFEMQWKEKCLDTNYFESILEKHSPKNVWFIYFTQDCPDFLPQAMAKGLTIGYREDFNGTTLGRVDQK